MRSRPVFLVLGLLLAGCAASEAPSPTTTTPPADDDGADGGTDGPLAATPVDPFAPLPDESEGLTNVSTDLDAVLEHGALAGACDRYRAGQTDRKTLLTCGKWMFFYETFGTSGIPAVLVKLLAQSFPDQLGIGFSKLGLIPDPGSADSLPLGLAPTVQLGGKVDALAFTCASCHFARLSDGRYAVGAPNHAYRYGTHILAIGLVPSVGLGLSQATDHDPAAIAAVQPLLDALQANSSLKTQLTLALLPLASLGSQPSLTRAQEHAYASWPSGTLDFNIAPLPVDDGVEIVGKIIGLWDLPRPAEVMSSGMMDAMLGWSGDAVDLDSFLGGFATFGGAALPTPDTLLPLSEYLYSLRAPSNPTPPDPARVAAGEQLFVGQHCVDCHDGPRGSGKRTYSFTEIGTDSALMKWLDPQLTGQPCCGITFPAGTTLTHALKSPRLTGMWALGRFLHNGSLQSLDELFCLGAPRPAGAAEPYRTDGHDYTCSGLGDDQKRALIAYLLAH